MFIERAAFCLMRSASLGDSGGPFAFGAPSMEERRVIRVEHLWTADGLPALTKKDWIELCRILGVPSDSTRAFLFRGCEPKKSWIVRWPDPTESGRRRLAEDGAGVELLACTVATEFLREPSVELGGRLYIAGPFRMASPGSGISSLFTATIGPPVLELR